MEKFVTGLLLGMAGGALLVANSKKTRALVKMSQDEIKEKIDAYIDQKLEGFENGEDKKAKKSALQNRNPAARSRLSPARTFSRFASGALSQRGWGVGEAEESSSREWSGSRADSTAEPSRLPASSTREAASLASLSTRETALDTSSAALSIQPVNSRAKQRVIIQAASFMRIVNDSFPVFSSCSLLQSSPLYTFRAGLQKIFQNDRIP